MDHEVPEEVDHSQLLAKMIEHESKFITITEHIEIIVEKLDPIARGIASIAFAFKGLLALGAASAAVVGIIELLDRIPSSMLGP